jgi:DNA polymerase-1
MTTLLLVDGSSYLYRAFHALPDLRNAADEPTGAIYGVLNMLRRLAKDVPADYIACVFDAKGKTFRDTLYPEYKAHRPPMPDDLARQLAPLKEAVAAMGWPVLVIDGVEGDDVIGTLAREAEQKGIETIISTGDKDMAQLVTPHVTLVNTMTNEKLTVEGVREKFGVPPERIVDYLALVGDASDNVPGVDKVGPKTAVKWLTQYGSLDALIAHAQEIGGVVGENLRRALPWLPKARELVTIRRDLDLPVHVTDLVPRPPDVEALKNLFRRFDFKSWLRELAENETSAPGDSIPPPGSSHATLATRYETILTEAALEEWLERLKAAPLVAVDTETTSLDPMAARLVGISFSTQEGCAAYLPLAHAYPGAPAQIPLETALARLRPWLESADHAKLGHNIKYDMHVFANHGIRLGGITHDTLLQSYVLEVHRPHDLDSAAHRHLHTKTLTYAEVTGKGAKQIGFEQVNVDLATRYAAEDADITLRLHGRLHPQLADDPGLSRVYHDIEMPLVEVLFDMERTGVLLDTEKLGAQSQELGQKLLALEAEAFVLAGQPFNLNSPKQIQDILFGRHGLPVKKRTPGGAPSTDEDVLQELALDYPLPKLLLEYRALSKLKSTYADKLPKRVDPVTRRVHTSYNQAVAVTGRLASSDPNLQNIPVRTPEGRRIREAFIAPPGAWLVSADYSQIELRIMAHLSQDEGLLKAFAEGQDIHRATAAEVFGVAPQDVTPEQRRYAKVINFGLIYGMSAFGLAGELGIERAAAQAWIDRYFSRYPGVAAYMERTREFARRHGYVETVFGRRLWLPEIRSGNPARRQAAERAAINAPMQGTAADIIKLAMIAVHRWLVGRGAKTRLILQVHDELVLEVPEAELATVKAELPRLMAGVAQLDVPLETEVGVGANWEQAH